MALGKDIADEPVVADLAKMLTAWWRGPPARAQVGRRNAMIISLLYKAKADQVLRLILIDPKRCSK